RACTARKTEPARVSRSGHCTAAHGAGKAGSGEEGRCPSTRGASEARYTATARSSATGTTPDPAATPRSASQET
ncbi:MAG: hypothetical protein WDK95_13160, partial [Syntrophorhabdaceae bacterium]